MKYLTEPKFISPVMCSNDKCKSDSFIPMFLERMDDFPFRFYGEIVGFYFDITYGMVNTAQPVQRGRDTAANIKTIA